MSIFGNLMSKILGHAARAQETKVNEAVAANAPAAAAPAVAEPVDVEAVLEGMAAQNTQTLDWRHSIVDLMKLVGIESDLASRKTLAQELGYTGSTDDSASMNVWLHKQVMTKLAENGGKVPASLMG